MAYEKAWVEMKKRNNSSSVACTVSVTSKSKQSKLTPDEHISDRNTTFSHQIESSSSLSGLPSSSKWKSIVMLASESCAEAKFVTDRVGIPIALSTENKQKKKTGRLN